MRYSQLFGKTSKTAPKDADSVSHKFLVQAGFIDQLSAGIYSFLPLGWRVHQKIANIIREEMDAIGGQEVGLPVLQPRSLWVESGRWDKMDPPLFVTKDRHDKELALGSTHEEVITDLVRDRVSSYKDLPLALYQIQTKFRNEMRATGGLLRVREFVMKDLYSFHADKDDLLQYFDQVKEAYLKVFARCGIKAIPSIASGGTIGGTTTYEFQVPAESGEDKIVYCEKCGWAANLEVADQNKHEHPTKRIATIEVGHIFALGTKYSEAMGLYFTDKDGGKKAVEMGCYGIGVGRLMATIIEVNNDQKGMIWPEGVAPYQCHLIAVAGDDNQATKQAGEVYERLVENGVEVLYDDRDAGAGEKFADADLIGIPVRLVISSRTKDKIEWKERGREETELVILDEVIKRLSKPRS